MPNKKIDDSDHFNEFRSASRLLTFLSEKSEERFDRLQKLNPQEHGEKYTSQFDDEHVAISEKLLQDKSITKSQLKVF